jgi:hypothetical protein
MDKKVGLAPPHVAQAAKSSVVARVELKLLRNFMEVSCGIFHENGFVNGILLQLLQITVSAKINL